MSNARTGFWSGVGAIAGGFAGVYAGRWMATKRPRVTYARESRGDAIEDAMVVGGATGAVAGAFIAGTLAGEETPPALPPSKVGT